MLFYREQTNTTKTVIVAEVGNVHDGSLGNCHAYIDAVADAGADAIKFQAHYECESTDAEQFPSRFQFHPQDRTRRDYWRRMSFALHEWYGLKEHASRRGLEFIVSPFSIHAVQELDLYVDRWKVASGEVNNFALLEAIRKTNKPVVVSSGLSDTTELDGAICALCPDINDTDRITILQCTTLYPTPPEKVGMNIAWQRIRGMVVRNGGLSDHSGTIWPSVTAAYLGASMVEVHVCWHKQQFGCDVSSSVTMDEFKQLVAGVRFNETMRRNPVDKEALAKELAAEGACYRQGKQRELMRLVDVGRD